MGKINLCKKCSAMCCKYIALEIDTPESRDEYENIRWYLAHHGVSVFVEKKKWYVSFAGECRHIDKNNMCSIYEKRPKICRKYTTEGCDRTSNEYDYQYHFTDDKQMEEYMKVKFDNMKIQLGKDTAVKKATKAKAKVRRKK